MGQLVVNSASAKHYYIISEDILSVQPAGDGVRIIVKWRQQYADDGRFKRVKFKFNQEMSVTFEGWQIKEAVEQIRDQEPDHCPECYDYGKMDAPPPECTRCLLLDACIRSGHGDHRKTKQRTIAPRRIDWLVVCFLMLGGIFWWTICQWANATTATEAAQRRAREAEAIAATFRRQAATAGPGATGRVKAKGRYVPPSRKGKR